MIAELRRRFNESYTPEKYGHFLDLIERRSGVRAGFRLSETPCFFPRDLIDKAARYGREMVESLLGDADYMRVSNDAIPPQWNVPREDPRPLFVQVDFGLDDQLEPKLVEIQGFPSLYAFQPLMSACYAEAYALEQSIYPFGEYEDLFRRAVLGAHDPENVVLLEIDPERQKTLPDFRVTEQICGIRTVDIAKVRKRGDRLFYNNDVPIRRIYNRAIVDELERRDIYLDFEFTDDLDVEWAGHPNWFFRLSKFSLPYLKHPSVPETLFLRDAVNVPDPENWVLKPLFSFAGLGVIVGPSREQIEASPKDDCVLQRRIAFRPVIDTPYGMTKVEIRIMYIWLDQMTPVNVIVRTGRGAQMGVDFNKGLDWVGASAAFIP